MIAEDCNGEETTWVTILSFDAPPAPDPGFLFMLQILNNETM